MKQKYPYVKKESIESQAKTAWNVDEKDEQDAIDAKIKELLDGNDELVKNIDTFVEKAYAEGKDKHMWIQEQENVISDDIITKKAWEKIYID